LRVQLAGWLQRRTLRLPALLRYLRRPHDGSQAAARWQGQLILSQSAGASADARRRELRLLALLPLPMRWLRALQLCRRRGFAWRVLHCVAAFLLIFI
jgi:hypothetical protein